MKTIFFGLMALTFVMQSNASANPYAPTLQSVVILNDLMEDDYSPFLFQAILGEILDMKMDDSCQLVQVSSNKSVYCISAAKKMVVVGNLGPALGTQEGWRVHSVNWYNNVSVIGKIKNGKTFYSVVVAP
jgi:hypothetical protein